MRTVNSHDRVARLSWSLIDGSLWIVAIALAMWLRYTFDLHEVFSRTTLIAAVVAAVIHIALGTLAGPYRRGHLRGSFDEVVDVTFTAITTTGIVLVWAIAARPGISIPRTVPIIAGFQAITFMLGARFVVRAARRHRTLTAERSQRVVVFGAGSAGRLLVRNLLNDNDSPYLPVALLDDDPKKRRASIEGVRVRGTRADIAKVSEEYDADLLVLAVPSAPGPVLHELADAAAAAGVKTKIVPPLHTLIGQKPTAADIRDINLEDLLGRRPITLDQAAISNQLTGKRVLVTGAGGSIGSELARQISKFSPQKLLLLDRDESALHAVELDISGHGLLDDDSMVLADIRDADALLRIFQEHRPQVVFHAAALKHLPLLERYPLEAWKSNVCGTLNVLRAAEAVEVETFVNISTDKAADPTCVLGYSKRMAERLTAEAATRTSGRYMSVRFGNVLGSRGSVIPAFTAQIRRGGPITVTHPDVERYFMLIPEACQLVMQAAVIGKDGEVMVLDMGQPVKILQVAKTLIQMSGRNDIEIKFTGLRPGEKMSEDLFNRSDASRPTEHPLVNSVDVPPLDTAVTQLVLNNHSEAARIMRSYALGATQAVTAVPTKINNAS